MTTVTKTAGRSPEPPDYPKEIVADQRLVGFSDGGRDYLRIKFGDESGDMAGFFTHVDIPCHDCGAVKGQYHVFGCDIEECPKCHGQFLGCPCQRTWDVELTIPPIFLTNEQGYNVETGSP